VTLRLVLKIIGLLLVLVVLAVGALVFKVARARRAYGAITDTHDLAQRVETLAKTYIAKRPNGALMLGVIERGKTFTRGFGHVSATNSSPPDVVTEFEIGSITKVFTAITLAKMVEAGQVNLTDPISRFLPSGVTAPQKEGKEVTMENLATHTSGLPRLPDNLWPTVTNSDDPYINYTAKDLYAGLGSVKLGSTPGKTSSYSNYGFGLLGHLLALKAGKPYEELVREAICVPLGLTNTAISLTPEQASKLTPGHNKSGAVVPNWKFDALAPAGALKSCAADMLKFVSENLNPDTTSISNALKEAQQIHFQELTGGVGLGWQITRTLEGRLLTWHNGGTGGYVSFIGFDRDAKVGVVLLSNYGDAMASDNSLDKMGMEILKLASKISLN